MISNAALLFDEVEIMMCTGISARQVIASHPEGLERSVAERSQPISELRWPPLLLLWHLLQ